MFAPFPTQQNTDQISSGIAAPTVHGTALSQGIRYVSGISGSSSGATASPLFIGASRPYSLGKYVADYNRNNLVSTEEVQADIGAGGTTTTPSPPASSGGVTLNWNGIAINIPQNIVNVFNDFLAPVH